MTDPNTLREITAAAAELYTAPLRRRAAVSYLHQRGIDGTLPPTWVIGYAPPGWTRLVDQLHGRFGEQALLDAGLGRVSSRGTLIDSFRDRVIFGVRGIDGTITGFIGRDLSGDCNAPKYLNTCQHALFDKSKLVFGLFEGSRATDRGQPVIVEGPLDVLAIASREQAGHNADLLPVAACGTSFTAAQARAVADAVRGRDATAVVAMDGDPAGRRAALRVGETLRGAGLDVRLAMLAAGIDPADYLSRPGTTREAFRADNALPMIHAHVEHAIASQGDSMQWIEGRLTALRTVARYLATYSTDYAGRQISWIAEALQLKPETVSSELVEAFTRTRRIEARNAADTAAMALVSPPTQFSAHL